MAQFTGTPDHAPDGTPRGAQALEDKLDELRDQIVADNDADPTAGEVSDDTELSAEAERLLEEARQIKSDLLLQASALSAHRR